MDKNQVIEYLKEKNEFKNKDIKILKPLKGGITNDNHLVEIDNKKYVLRLPTPSSRKMIDRKIEYKNNTIGCDLGLNAPCIYFNSENGIKIAEYIEKSDIDIEEFKEDKEAIEKIAKTIKKLHNSHIVMENDFDIFEKLKLYEDITKENKGWFPEDYEDIKDKVLKIYSQLENKYGFSNEICHNDALAENFILSKDDRVYLIDWEYGGNNDQAWDLTSFLIEGELSKENMEVFINSYLDGEKLEDEIIDKIKFFTIYQDFLWSVWTLVKLSSKEEGYEDYFEKRYTRTKRNIEIFNNNRNKGLEYYLKG